MNGVASLDILLFRLVNTSLSNPILDRLMPFFSTNPFYVPALVVILGWLVWKGGARGRICAACVILSVAIGDGIICKLIKEVVGRPRPFLQLENVHLLVGKGGSGSMPSSHAANSFAMAMVFFIFYRRSLMITLPLALIVSFSRMYVGVHFPSDVLAGAVLGAGYAAGLVWTLDAAWKWAGKRWFSLWWARLPSLMAPECAVEEQGMGAGIGKRENQLNQHWLCLGYFVTVVLVVVQVLYLRSGLIELSEDEAYQWTWSKHLALSYYSKPPLIAVVQWAGTHLFGDTELGVRFFSPVSAGILALVLLRFFAGMGRAALGFGLMAALMTAPILAVGSILMTVDPLLVLFWTLAMLAGWKAVRFESGVKEWSWVGLWMGLSLLSKYTALFQLISWVGVFASHTPSRVHIRRAGPWVALGIMLLCAAPVCIWNFQHGWITVQHVANDGKLGQEWRPTLKFFWDFMGAETVLLNPFYVFLLVLALVVAGHSKDSYLDRYFIWMGAPVFVFYLIFTLHSRVLPNWIAPGIVPLFCLVALRWELFGNTLARIARILFALGAGIGLLAAVLLHDTRLFQKAFQRALPPRVDPLKRLLGWKEFGAAIQAKRNELLGRGGDVFIIGDHYGLTGLMSFYVPEAKGSVSGKPLVYFVEKDRPENQYFFWPGYLEERRGQNALFVQSIDSPKMAPNWIAKWLKEGDSPSLNGPLDPVPPALPPELKAQFKNIEDLGSLATSYKGRTYHYFHLYYCQDAQPSHR